MVCPLSSKQLLGKFFMQIKEQKRSSPCKASDTSQSLMKKVKRSSREEKDSKAKFPGKVSSKESDVMREDEDKEEVEEEIGFMQEEVVETIESDKEVDAVEIDSEQEEVVETIESDKEVDAVETT